MLFTNKLDEYHLKAFNHSKINQAIKFYQF